MWSYHTISLRRSVPSPILSVAQPATVYKQVNNTTDTLLKSCILYVQGEFIAVLGCILYVQGEFIAVLGCILYVQGEFIAVLGCILYVQGEFIAVLGCILYVRTYIRIYMCPGAALCPLTTSGWHLNFAFCTYVLGTLIVII